MIISKRSWVVKFNVRGLTPYYRQCNSLNDAKALHEKIEKEIKELKAIKEKYFEISRIEFSLNYNGEIDEDTVRVIYSNGTNILKSEPIQEFLEKKSGKFLEN